MPVPPLPPSLSRRRRRRRHLAPPKKLLAPGDPPAAPATAMPHVALARAVAGPLLSRLTPPEGRKEGSGVMSLSILTKVAAAAAACDRHCDLEGCSRPSLILHPFPVFAALDEINRIA